MSNTTWECFFQGGNFVLRDIAHGKAWIYVGIPRANDLKSIDETLTSLTLNHEHRCHLAVHVGSHQQEEQRQRIASGTVDSIKNNQKIAIASVQPPHLHRLIHIHHVGVWNVDPALDVFNVANIGRSQPGQLVRSNNNVRRTSNVCRPEQNSIVTRLQISDYADKFLLVDLRVPSGKFCNSWPDGVRMINKIAAIQKSVLTINIAKIKKCNEVMYIMHSFN